jgi:hypothetical protein
MHAAITEASSTAPHLLAAHLRQAESPRAINALDDRHDDVEDHMLHNLIYLFSIDSQRRITVGQASLACVRSLA